MEVREYTRINMEEILPLYAAVGWTNYTDRPDMLQAAYENSRLILAAREDEQLVGILRAVGDGASIMFIQDILVLPTHQRRGIGTALMREALSRLKDVYQVELMTDDSEETKAFYESVGLKNATDMGCLAFVRM